MTFNFFFFQFFFVLVIIFRFQAKINVCAKTLEWNKQVFAKNVLHGRGRGQIGLDTTNFFLNFCGVFLPRMIAQNFKQGHILFFTLICWSYVSVHGSMHYFILCTFLSVGQLFLLHGGKKENPIFSFSGVWPFMQQQVWEFDPTTQSKSIKTRYLSLKTSNLEQFSKFLHICRSTDQKIEF